jgi:hypothetical protein
LISPSAHDPALCQLLTVERVPVSGSEDFCRPNRTAHGNADAEPGEDRAYLMPDSAKDDQCCYAGDPDDDKGDTSKVSGPECFCQPLRRITVRLGWRGGCGEIPVVFVTGIFRWLGRRNSAAIAVEELPSLT